MSASTRCPCCVIYRQTHRPTDRQAYRQTHRHTDRGREGERETWNIQQIEKRNPRMALLLFFCAFFLLLFFCAFFKRVISYGNSEHPASRGAGDYVAVFSRRTLQLELSSSRTDVSGRMLTYAGGDHAAQDRSGGAEERAEEETAD